MVVKDFLPIRYIGQLRRLITVMEAEIVSDEELLLVCKEAIDQRREKILEYQETINNVRKQMDNYNCLLSLLW